jgi:heptaprenyl diphosphate synthase
MSSQALGPAFLGVAFQLADDLKDLLGGDPGKDRFSDVRNRAPSLPIVLALAASPAWRDRQSAAWARSAPSLAEAHELGEQLVATGAAAVELLQQEVASAFEMLGPERETPWGQELVALAGAFPPGNDDAEDSRGRAM